jgi:hypothetical protein
MTTSSIFISTLFCFNKENTVSLSQLLANELKNSTMSDDQGPWRQFILDHLDYIARRTAVYEITSLLMNQYRYDLARFLREHMSLRSDLAWIVILLNNMSTDLEFDTPGEFIIPTDELIDQLYHSYTTKAS